MKHKWVAYDIAKAQIREVEFESNDDVVEVTLELAEQLLREKGFVPKEEFDAKMDKLLKAVYSEEGKQK